jgi:putative ABC transport system permease protein
MKVLASGNAVSLTEDDAKSIMSECPAVASAAPTSRGGGQAVFGNNNWATTVQGTTPEYLRIREIGISSGSEFTDQDVASASKVVLLGKTVIDSLFAGDDPVGQVIRIRKAPFTVVGTLAPKGQSPSGQDQDDVIITPITTAKKELLRARQANAGSVGSIMVQVRALLRQRHHVQPDQDDDFSVRNLEEVFSAQEDSSRVMSMLLASIASVSLIVGGIGIMNIMLAPVTERTREIGLRQAAGAKTRDILLQSLVEAVTLALLGGVIGILTGVAASALISRLADWSTRISPASMLLAFVCSALVGVFFGYYPARRAAFLDPIDALRYE